MKQVNIRIPQRILALMMGLFLSIGAYAQITVQGHVKDATGEPVIGATVTVVGTTNTVATDFDGNFTITAPAGAQLQVSSIGLQPQTVTAAPNLVIELVDDSEMLKEVVVIGYGTVRKSDLTGSVTALKPDAKNKGVVVSAQDMLGGKIAGVNVTDGGGTPGGGATIRIRGGSSLNATNDPLIVIDGVPMDNNGVKGLANGLSLINPADIETFNVLKDASATAIYGSRGSNGVIIITTKKGRRGQGINVLYNGSFTVSTKKKNIDVLSGDEYRDYIKEIYKGNSREEQAIAALGTANTNWQNEIYRTALSHDHNLTVTGSVKDFLPFRVSVGYTDQQGILKTSDFKRYTVSGNISPSLFNDHLTFNINAKYMYAKSRYADGSAIGNAVRMDPTQPIRSEDPLYKNFGGYFNWLSAAALNDDAWPYTVNTNAPRNPVAILELKNDRANSHAFVGNIDADYKVHGFEDLRLHLTLGGDFSKGKQTTDVDPASPLAAYYGSHGWDEITKENRTLSTYAQYYKDFNDDHHFDIMAGYEWQHFWRKQHNNYWGFYQSTSNEYLKDSEGHYILDEGGNMIPAAGQKYNETWLYNGLGFRTENYLVSFFGRMNYIFKNRYYLTATVRHDGSSRFKKHWSTFPSFAFAWRIKEEGFLKDNNTLSELKLRLGWGKTGQQDIGSDYNYFTNYSMNSGVPGSFYDIVGDGTMARPNVYNPQLKWETTTTTNIGLDWGFLNGRITGTIDWYYRKTTDLLNYASIPVGNFRNMANQNIGSLKNTGLELSISWKAISTNDLLWTIDYNFTYNKNEITELVGGIDANYKVLTGGVGINKNCQAHAVGYPANSFYVYQQVYDEAGMPIENQVVDRNADGQITDDDRYFYKAPFAPVTMGLSSRLEWKNWDFGFNMRASIGNYVFNNVMKGYANVGLAAVFESVSGSYLNNRPVDAIKYGWATYDDASQLSDRWVKNASFLKCDNITLGYSFSDLFKRNGGYHGLSGRVYGTVSNVFCITKYDGIDPEISYGIDNDMYPRPISFILGLSLNF